MPSLKSRIIEQVNFTDPNLGKSFENQIKTIEEQDEKQIKAIKDNKQVDHINVYSYEDKVVIKKNAFKRKRNIEEFLE